MTIVLDTNVLVSALTDRSPDQQKAAERLIRDAAAGEHRLVVPFFVLLELRYVLSKLYALNDERIAVLIRALAAVPGLSVSSDLLLSRWLELWPEVFPDPPDAALAVVAERSGWAVATFDQSFVKRLASIGVTVFEL